MDATSQHSKRRFIVHLILFTLLCIAVGAGWGLLSEKALGDGGKEVTVPTAERCVMDSAYVNCPTAAQRKVRQFKNGRLGRAHGIPVHRAYRSPAVARELWVNKITWKLKHRGKTVVDRYARTVPGARVCTTERCVAYKMYGEMVRNSTCVGKGGVYASADPNACFRPTARLTKQQIQNTGAVILCGGAVVFGVSSSTASAGTTAFIAIWGATSCGWSFWMSID